MSDVLQIHLGVGRLKKKYVFLLFFTISIISIIYTSSSYTNAIVSSELNLSLTEQDDALIAITSSSLPEITQGGDSGRLELNIVNRIAGVIELQAGSFEDANFYIEFNGNQFSSMDTGDLELSVFTKDTSILGPASADSL